MSTLSRLVTTRELREGSAGVVSRVLDGGERVGITRQGELVAAVISVDDLELLEQLEDARDIAAFRAAQSTDVGRRVSLTDLRDELGV